MAIPAPVFPFQEIWLLDFEFRQPDGHRPRVACMAAREVRTGRTIQMWENELRALRRAPFATDETSLIVIYTAAEMSCFLDLGWPVPARVIDLYAEYKAMQNGRDLRAEGYGLVSAMIRLGIPTRGAEYKDAMRDVIIHRDSHQWTMAERKEILTYCQSDADALGPLLAKLAPFITRGGRQTIAQALYRGRYAVAVARMEREGVPIDTGLWGRLVASWGHIRMGLIRKFDRYGFYTDAGSFSFAAFSAFLADQRIDWPTTPSGRPATDSDTIDAMLVVRPDLADFRELKATLDKMKLNKLAIGPDGRNRVGLMPYGTITGRNAPSTTRFIFGPSKWIRHLIVPPPGMALAYLDWKSQEICIAAGLSGDEGLIADYHRDPYLGYAIRTGLAPTTATQETHGDLRDAMKPVVLGVNYGLGARSLGRQTGRGYSEARKLLEAHRDAYGRFWDWSERQVTAGVNGGELVSRLGWPIRPRSPKYRNPRCMLNWPMQAGGAECLRLSACMATEAGFSIAAPVHDALVVTAPSEDIENHARGVAEIMEYVGQHIAGISMPVEIGFVRSGERFRDKRGAALFEVAVGLINEGERHAA